MNSDTAESEELAIEVLLHMTKNAAAEESFRSTDADNYDPNESDEHSVGEVEVKTGSRSRKRTGHFKVKKNRSSLIAVQFPKGDVRNNYAESYFEAVNSGNYQIILKTLTDMCSPDVLLVSKFDKSPDNDFTPEHLEVNGIVAMAAVMVEAVRSSPDAVLQIVTKQVEVYRNGESVVTVVWNFRGTKVYDIEGLKGGCTDKIVVSTVPSASSGVAMDSLTTSMEQLQVTSTTVSTALDPVTGKKVEIQRTGRISTGEMMENAREVQFTATNSFYINKDKRLYLIVSNQQKEKKP